MLLRNALMIAVAAGAVSMTAPAFAQTKSPGDVNAGKSNAGSPTYVIPGQPNERANQGDGGGGSTSGTTGAGTGGVFVARRDFRYAVSLVTGAAR